MQYADMQIYKKDYRYLINHVINHVGIGANIRQSLSLISFEGRNEGVHDAFL